MSYAEHMSVDLNRMVNTEMGNEKSEQVWFTATSFEEYQANAENIIAPNGIAARHIYKKHLVRLDLATQPNLAEFYVKTKLDTTRDDLIMGIYILKRVGITKTAVIYAVDFL